MTAFDSNLVPVLGISESLRDTVEDSPFSADWSTVISNPGLPIPPAADTLAGGYDAIIQLKNDVVPPYVRRILSNNLNSRVSVGYHAVPIPSAIQELVDQALEDTNASLGYGEFAMFEGTTPTPMLEPVSWIIRLHPATAEFTSQDGGRVTVNVTAQIRVQFEESEESRDARLAAMGVYLPDNVKEILEQREEQTGQVTRRMRQAHIAQGTFAMSMPIEFDVAASSYSITTRANFSNADFEFSSTPSAFAMLISSGLGSRIEQVLRTAIGKAQVLPIVELTGRGEYLLHESPLPRFLVQTKITYANTAGNQVLSFCIETGPGGRSTDLSLVGPFNADRRFAYAAREELVDIIARFRFRTISADLTRDARDAPVEVNTDDGDQTWTAKIAAHYKTLNEVTLDYTSVVGATVLLGGRGTGKRET